MKAKTLFQSIKKFFSPPEGPAAQEFHFVRPFYIMVILMLVVVFGVSVTTQPELQSISRLSAYTFLMVLHGVLHWRSIVLVERPGWNMYYILVQSVIALSIIHLAQASTVSFGIIAAMIGETFGILREKRGLAFMAIGLLLAGTFGVIQNFESESPMGFVIVTLPMVLFVVIYVEVFSRQTEAREHAQGLLRELESAHQELSEYAARVEELTLHAERERMAFELHDTLGQGIAGLVLQLEAVKNHLENERVDRAKQIVAQAMGTARSTLAESRAVIDDLRQIKTGEISLQEMIERLAKNLNESNGLHVDVKIILAPEDLEIPPLVLEYVDRIISEVFFNITRHAQAANVSVDILGNVRALTVEIKDDGIGFDVNRIGKDGRYGLLGIQERAHRIGGTLQVESQPNNGAMIKVVFPLNQPGVSR
ncbi:MAG: sensor histidine kinase [Anaerolineae bacterium]|nr:sensor histidine kinase [Anaerolineae bacterium]